MRHAELILHGQIHTGEKTNSPAVAALAIADGRVVGRGGVG